jgi:heptosyltransferase-2
MNFQRILIRATNWVGDAVMCVPALEAVRARFPHAHIAVLARPWVAGLYGPELADEVIPYTAGRGWKDLAAKWRLAAQLRAGKFDCTILLQNAFEAAALARLAGIPRRIGYNRDGRGWLLTDSIAVPKKDEVHRHERFYYLELLLRAGIIDTIPPVNSIRLRSANRHFQAGFRRLIQFGFAGDVVGISPGAAFGGAKRWLPERFAEASLRLAQNLNAGVAVFGSGDERELCARVASMLESQGCEVRNLAGETTLAEFIDLAAACRVFLTNDSGAMHIASALGVPTVAVFGATDDIGTGPTGHLARVVREDVDCSPCLLRECPIDHRCMTGVSAERVSGVAMELIQLRS